MPVDQACAPHAGATVETRDQRVQATNADERHPAEREPFHDEEAEQLTRELETTGLEVGRRTEEEDEKRSAEERKREEAEAQAKRVAALRDYARLSRLRFDNGYASYLEVLYAENELFGAELVAVRSQAERFTQIVNVYQALGGGWIE